MSSKIPYFITRISHSENNQFTYELLLLIVMNNLIIE